jgi:hypothetical protein
VSADTTTCVGHTTTVSVWGLSGPYLDASMSGWVCYNSSSVWGTSVVSSQGPFNAGNKNYTTGYWNSNTSQVTFWANFHWYPFLSPFGINDVHSYPRMTYVLGKGWGCYMGGGTGSQILKC